VRNASIDDLVVRTSQSVHTQTLKRGVDLASFMDASPLKHPFPEQRFHPY
jgi:hypothetical protein